MFESVYPKFSKGRVIKTGMLEALRDFPRDIFSIGLSGERNGIITGCGLAVKEGSIAVLPGIVHMNGEIYLSRKPVEISYVWNNCLTYLKIRCPQPGHEEDYDRAVTQVSLNEREPQPDELEICRFKLREGAKLRNQYVDFGDFHTEYDTVNRIHAAYVCGGADTLAPEILLWYARELLSCKGLDPADTAFCFQVRQNNGRIAGGLLEDYLLLSGCSIPAGSFSRALAYRELHTLLEKKKENPGERQEEEYFNNAILLD